MQCRQLRQQQRESQSFLLSRWVGQCWERKNEVKNSFAWRLTFVPPLFHNLSGLVIVMHRQYCTILQPVSSHPTLALPLNPVVHHQCRYYPVMHQLCRSILACTSSLLPSSHAPALLYHSTVYSYLATVVVPSYHAPAVLLHPIMHRPCCFILEPVSFHTVSPNSHAHEPCRYWRMTSPFPHLGSTESPGSYLQKISTVEATSMPPSREQLALVSSSMRFQYNFVQIMTYTHKHHCTY